jgi:hypothetical protein
MANALCFDRFLHQRFCFLGAELAEDYEFFSHEALVGDEEVLDLVDEVFVEVAEAAGRTVFPGEDGHGEQAVVLFHFAIVLALPGF